MTRDLIVVNLVNLSFPTVILVIIMAVLVAMSMQ